MKKILFLILASVLSVGLHAQTSNYGHAASLGSNAADAGGDIVGPGSSTNNAFARFSGTTGKLLQDTPDLTYVSPTMSVPDAFVVSSAGSIGLTAGGSNKGISVTTTGTGVLGINASTIPPAFTNSVFNANRVIQVGFFSSTPNIYGVRSQGSLGAESAVGNGNTLLAISGVGYDGSAYGIGSSVNFVPMETWSGTQRGSKIIFNTVRSGQTSAQNAITFGDYGQVILDFANGGKGAAWGATGAMLAVKAGTITDSTSSGTVATAVANSFAVPTFAASSATTFTNAANLYIAGDVAAGTNVTLTNSYGLWNAGKTRLDGNALLTGTKTLGFGATAAATIGVSADTTAGVLTLTAPSSGSISLTKTISSYNGLTTAGLGVPTLTAAPAISATKTANFTVATFTPPAAVGTYRIDGVITTTSSTNTGTVQFTVDYVDSQGTTHTADVIPLLDAAGSIATTKTGASKEFSMVSRTLTTNNAASNIVVKVVITGTVSYTVTATIERVN